MPTLQILPLNHKDASPAEYAALNRHNNTLRCERLPEDPPIPLDEMIEGFKNIPSLKLPERITAA